ncbi:hypothetical protein CCR95_19915 [Thiocystis minor]|uniref:hypothetical protein n=1 Tax=Thiocystis minor TaxID=61597 RepID=UPI001911A612|nr:hypothetical protein [Thiocystis minor]MBK5966289.1 hypothetical protein [Thiocystis minor]
MGLLRFFDESGAPIPTLPEVIDQEQARADQERERANQERLRADRLAERLRVLGIDPELN